MEWATKNLLGTLLFAAWMGVAGAAVPARTVLPRTSIVPPRYGVFAEALVPFGVPDAQETGDLQTAITAYQAAGDPAHMGALDGFLERYPHSVWRVALLTNEGLAYAHAGQFSKALDRLQAAWRAGRSTTLPAPRALADRAFGALLHLHTAFGHAEKVQALLADTEDRTLSGPAAVDRTIAREALWSMQHEPGRTFICGLVALRELLKVAHDTAGLTRLQNVQSKPGGMTLARLQTLAGRAGLPAEAVYRRGMQPIPVPAIVHWTVGHYATIVAKTHNRFRVKDAAMGREFWMSPAAVRSESSGYFLIPTPDTHTPWRKVAAAEAEHVVGAGITPGNDPDATSDDDPDICGCGAGGSRGMAQYSVKAMLVSLSLHDTPLDYTPPKGPAVPITLVYSQREANQPANFIYFNFGQKWTSNWLSYVEDDPAQAGSSVMLYLRGGGTRYEHGYSGATGAFAHEPRTGAQLVAISTSPIVYERRLPDGSKAIYSASDNSIYYPRRVFLSQVVDPTGNRVSLDYDAQMRLVHLTDALGQQTTFHYDNSLFSLQVTSVTDPFGRTATIAYDASGRLISITDALGMQSAFAYDSAVFITSMTTPYGTTRFAGGQSGTERWLEITDPENHTERVEFRHNAPGIPFSTSPVPSGIATFNRYLNSRNTFFWDKAAMERAPGDYTQAHIYHWLHEEGRDHSGLTAGVLESTKRPLEHRVWFNYPAQSWAGGTGGFDKPSAVARVLDDGSTQIRRFEYNAVGRVTRAIDPLGRELDYTFAPNGIDRIEVIRKTASGQDVLAQFTYNDQHEPVSYTDAAGQITYYAYNAAGQLTRKTDPLGNATQYQYDTDGYLLAVIDTNGETVRGYTYDRYGRVASVTDAEGHTVHYAYDALDRLTGITYPDGTQRIVNWDKLDVASTIDREGRTTTYTYDPVRDLISRTDPLGQVTQYGYDPTGRMQTLTDPNGNTTTWTRDIDERVSQRAYADGAGDAYVYNAIGRLKSKTDALGQITQYRYTRAGRLAAIQYANVLNATPGVSFSYDPVYPRLVSRVDGQGTTAYTYYPAGVLGAGRLQSEQGDNPHDTIGYTYDVLGRRATRIIDGAEGTYRYDGLGRLIGEVNSLGDFTNTYLGETSQPTGWTVANVPYWVTYQYEGNLHDRRLKAILSDAEADDDTQPVMDYSYTTSPTGLILSRSEDDGTEDAHRHRHRWWRRHHLRISNVKYTYDDALRLTGVQGSDPASYTYDAANNVTELTAGGAPTSIAVNNLNQIDTAGGVAYRYDANGNLIDDGQRNYTWDAADRLIEIEDKQTGHVSEFQYDGLSRRISDTESDSGGTPSETRFLWCGQRLCEHRDAADAEIARYYRQGEVRAGQVYYYAQDQVGSVVALVDTTGHVAGRLAYDAYGNITDSSGTLPDFRYAGLFYHQPTGLDLATYRAYSTRRAKWLSRDPIGENSETNLYAYVANNPISFADPLGLFRFGRRPLGGIPFMIPAGSSNLGLLHENGFYGNGGNVGYFPEGIRPDSADNINEYSYFGPYYNDRIMQDAVDALRNNGHWQPNDSKEPWYSNRNPDDYDLLQHNCQDFSDALRNEYKAIGGTTCQIPFVGDICKSVQ